MSTINAYTNIASTPANMLPAVNLSEYLAVQHALKQGMFPDSNPKPVLRADAPIWTPKLDEERQCDFCGEDVGEYGGNNPAPLKGTKCCDDCNETKVRPARMAQPEARWYDANAIEEETLVEGEIMVEWDTDDETPDLPKTVKIPAMKSDDVADYLSDNYGWCVNNWELVV